MTKDQIPAADILTIVPAPDGAAVVAIHDRATRRLDIVCSVHGTPSTILLSRGCTDNDMDRYRHNTAAAAAQHAAIRHTPRVDSEGATS